MEKVLVSSCLLGNPVRYDGRSKLSGNAILARWHEQGRLVPICPEVAAGLPTPRAPAEIASRSGQGNPGDAVLAGHAGVMDRNGVDVTDVFLNAARFTVALAKRHGCRHAVLTDGSPSCGSSFVYDGSFSGVKLAGSGVTARALVGAGFTVWPESGIAALARRIG